MVKNHVSIKMVFGYNALRRTTFLSWPRVYLRLPLRRAHQQLQYHNRRKVQCRHLFQHRLIVREQMIKNGKPSSRPNQKFKTQQYEDHEPEWATPSSSEIPEWLQEFRENLVDESVPEPHDSNVSSSDEPSFGAMWTTLNWLERNKISIRCGKYPTKKSIWENQYHSLIMSTWDVLKDTVKHANIMLTLTEPCLNPDFPQEQRNNYEARKRIPTWSNDMEGHAKKCVERPSGPKES